MWIEVDNRVIKKVRDIQTDKKYICLILAFDMNHIKKLKVNELRVILWYIFGSLKLKGIPKKVELVEDV